MIYVDSSAFLKRYLKDIDTPVVLEAMNNDQHWVASYLTKTESQCVLRRRLSAAGKLDHWEETSQQLDSDLQMFALVSLTHDICDEATGIVQEIRCGTLDAIHVASARLVKPDLFLTFDKEQADAARHFGLETVGA